jgi:pyruvate formate lyase activating enzyme
VETAGYVPWESIEQIMPVTDLFLYDIKMFDEIAHKKYTGKINSRILKNCKKIVDFGARVIIRMPVIPGINDSLQTISEVAMFAGGIHASGLELLPYHDFGKEKYSKLGKSYTLDKLQRIDEESMNKLKAYAERTYKKAYSD